MRYVECNWDTNAARAPVQIQFAHNPEYMLLPHASATRHIYDAIKCESKNAQEMLLPYTPIICFPIQMTLIWR